MNLLIGSRALNYWFDSVKPVERMVTFYEQA